MTHCGIISAIRMTANQVSSIGERLRAARLSRELSLGDVAGQAGVSAATLSRIENNKQSLDLPLFLQLTRILGVRPGALIEDGDGNHSADELIEILAALRAAERARIFAAANERSRSRRSRSRPSRPASTASCSRSTPSAASSSTSAPPSAGSAEPAIAQLRGDPGRKPSARIRTDVACGVAPWS